MRMHHGNTHGGRYGNDREIIWEHFEGTGNSVRLVDDLGEIEGKKLYHCLIVGGADGLSTSMTFRWCKKLPAMTEFPSVSVNIRFCRH